MVDRGASQLAARRQALTRKKDVLYRGVDPQPARLLGEVVRPSLSLLSATRNPTSIGTIVKRRPRVAIRFSAKTKSCFQWLILAVENDRFVS